MNPEIIASAAAIDLGGQLSFQTEQALMAERSFGFTITNDTGSDVTITLNDSYKGTGTNVIADGTITTNVTGASTSDKTIAEFKKYFAKKPGRVLMTQIESSDEAQLAKSLVTQEVSIWGDQPVKKIPLAAYKSPNYQNNKLINVNKPISFDDETLITLIVPKRAAEGSPTITTVTFFFGAVYNPALALYRLAQAGGGQVD